VVLFLAPLLPACSALVSWYGGSGPDVSVTVLRSGPVGMSQLAMGITHTQYSLDPWGDADAVRAGRQLLQASTVFQNQHLMGWGALNPEPSPGVYDWSSLDRRLTLIRETGGVPVVTLCCAPDWMKDGRPGMTDWSRLEVAPAAEHYADFAALAMQVALRYPDVQYYQVWNELKGFWNAPLNRWDYEAYTAFYNEVYAALKAVNPAIQVGGPYVPLDSELDRAYMSNPTAESMLRDQPYGTVDQRALDVLTYWLANKVGADFVVVDTSSYDGAPTEPFSATQKYVDLVNWLRQRTALPVWWAEWYVAPSGSASPEFDNAMNNALMAMALAQMATSGSAVQLRWEPQGQAAQAHAGGQQKIWTDTRVAGGGQPLPYYATQKAFKDYFPPGTLLYNAAVSSQDVAVLSSATHTLLINKRAASLTVSVDGTFITMTAYEVEVV
jgi:hypothetical protein